MEWFYSRVLSPHILNENNKKRPTCFPPTTPDIANVPATELAAQINKSILRLYGKFLSDDGKSVDYKGIADSEEFHQFVAETHKLKSVNLHDLSQDERKAFFLNIYNALVIHGYIVYGIPKDKIGFYQRTCYNLGGLPFSLDDIEHGILRGNRKHPAFFISTQQFGEQDPRKELIVDKVDPRVHFALVCGAKSCPPIRVYNSSNLEEGLNLAARVFCNEEHNLLINVRDKSIHVSSLFKWYLSDFASSKEELLAWIKQFLDDGNKKKLESVLQSPPFLVDYIAYDWSLNDGH